MLGTYGFLPPKIKLIGSICVALDEFVPELVSKQAVARRDGDEEDKLTQGAARKSRKQKVKSTNRPGRPRNDSPAVERKQVGDRYDRSGSFARTVGHFNVNDDFFGPLPIGGVS